MLRQLTLTFEVALFKFLLCEFFYNSAKLFVDENFIFLLVLMNYRMPKNIYLFLQDASHKLPSKFSLVEWLNNSEDDYVDDQIFSSLELNHLSYEDGKNIEDSNASFLEEQILPQELECYKDLEGFFENSVEGIAKSEPNMERSRVWSASGENDSNYISMTDKINETFIELPQWTFDNLYEDINGIQD